MIDHSEAAIWRIQTILGYSGYSGYSAYSGAKGYSGSGYRRARRCAQDASIGEFPSLTIMIEAVQAACGDGSRISAPDPARTRRLPGLGGFSSRARALRGL
jgi:hypothetical protein